MADLVIGSARKSDTEFAPIGTLHGRPVSTRFGDMVDVRNRGTLRLARMVGIQIPGKEAPAVVRLWQGDHCRELSIGEARALAEQLLEAARFAEQQNTDAAYGATRHPRQEYTESNIGH